MTTGWISRQRLNRLRRPAWPAWLRRTRPLSDVWGFDRGIPVDRYYIERFLEEHRHDIRGRVLEVKDRAYTQRYGTGVESSDVLDIDPTNALATVVADLTCADAIAADSFDCFILTQTLHIIYDTRAAIRHAHRVLRRNGVLLLTGPAVSRISRRVGIEGDYWRFTTASAGRLIGEAFGAGNVSVRSYGNVLTAMAFLMGMAQEELPRRQLRTDDEFFPVVVAARAVKR